MRSRFAGKTIDRDIWSAYAVSSKKSRDIGHSTTLNREISLAQAGVLADWAAEDPVREANAGTARLVSRRDCDRYDVALGDTAVRTMGEDLHRHRVAGVDAGWNLGVHLE